MTLDDLRKMVSEMEDFPGNLTLVMYDDNFRLRDLSLDIEIAGRDSKDKYSRTGSPVLLVRANI